MTPVDGEDDSRAVLLDPPMIGAAWEEAVAIAFADLRRATSAYADTPSPTTRLHVARCAGWVACLFGYENVAVVKVQ